MITEHFSKEEMKCKCCKELKFDIRLLVKLELLRSMMGGIPILINSGYRCPKHNEKVGGAKNSYHMVGKAADIKVNGNMDELYYFANIIFNQGGVGKYQTFIHVDTGNKRRFTGK